MADNTNIEITVSKDALQQIPQLKTSIDNLRSSIVNLNKEILNYNKQSQDTIDWGSKVKSKIKELMETYDTFQKLITLVKEGFGGWIGILSASLTIITTYGDSIVELATSLFKGNEAINQAKISIVTLNKALGDTDYSNAIKQVNELKININLAKQGFINKKEVVQQYNDLLGKTTRTATSLDEVEKNVTKNGEAYIKMTLYKATAQLALQDSATKAYEAQQDLLKSDDDSLNWWDKVADFFNHNAGAAGTGSQGIANAGEKADKYRHDLAVKRRHTMQEKADAESKTLFEVAKNYQTKAAELAKTFGFDFFNGEAANKPEPTEDYSRAKNKLQTKSIDFAKIMELDKQQYDQEMAMLNTQQANKLISQDQYDQKSTELQEKYHLAIGEKVKTFSQTELEEVQKHMADMVSASGWDIAKEHIEQERDETLSNDEHDAKKAIMPADKLAAENKWINDKYNYEVLLANGNTEKIKEIENQRQQDLTAIAQSYEEQRKDFTLQSAQKVSDAAFGMLKSSIQSQSDAKIKGLETQKQAELNNSNLTADQKRAIEDKYKKKEADEKVKAFKAEQKASILQAVINGALAITKATSQTGVLAPFVIPGIIVETAIQVATIAKQKAPQYAKGGIHYTSDGRGALLPGYSRTDDTNAYLRSGEAVVVSEAMRNPWARNLVSAINVAHGGRDFSAGNPGRGYAIGGIFTDGGSANRYYSQPANDVKDLANTLAYQMINNFPPIYVDVKDVNNQQNILAQTVNRVNL